MPADVDPKKSRKRSNDGGGFFSTIPGISSGKFYLKQLGYLALVIVVLTVIYDFSLFIHNNPLYKAQITVSGLEKLEKNAVTNVLSTGYPQDGSVSLTEISVGEVKEALETSLPRLKNIRVMKDYPNQLIVTVEDHYPAGGIGEAVAGELAGSDVEIARLAVEKMPQSGKPDELLAVEEIDKDAIVKTVTDRHES